MEFTPTEMVYSHRSDFQTIEVSQNKKLRVLRTDNKAIQSALLFSNPEQLVLSYMRAMMTVLLFQARPKNVLLLGLGGGDLLRFLHHHMTQTQITAIDIDVSIIEASRNYFALPDSDRINIHADDAMHFLDQDKNRYGMLLVDIYTRAGMPTFLHSDHFYQCCHQHLQNDGVLVLNLLTSDADCFRNILWMIRQRFDRSTLCLTVPGCINVLVFAFRKRPARLTASALLAEAQRVEIEFDLDLTEWVRQLFSTNPTEGGELIF